MAGGGQGGQQQEESARDHCGVVDGVALCKPPGVTCVDDGVRSMEKVGASQFGVVPRVVMPEAVVAALCVRCLRRWWRRRRWRWCR